MSLPSLPMITLVATLPERAGRLVVGLGADGLVGVPAAVDAAYARVLGRGLAEVAASIGATSKAGHTRTVPPVEQGPAVLVVGLGDEAATPESLRRAAGTGVRQALAHAESAGTIVLSLGAEHPETLQAVAEGALLGSYRFAPLAADRDDSGPSTSLAVIFADPRSKTAQRILTEAGVVAAAVLAAREWVNLPPNVLYPASFADEVKTFVRSAGISVEVLDDKALERGGYGGILAVGGGSSRPPRLVRLSYSPRGARSHLALVGKGITFDSGGLNLKPGDSMYTMKSDMAGAAAVFAATRAIAALGLKIKVTAYGSLAENLPSDTAYRPSDVLTMYGGTTVENGNTDAEGRLVLADALVRAGEDDPDLIVDLATLTGACVVALGDRTAGLMTTDDETADRLLDAAEAAGEDLWQLPIPRETRGRLDSKVADLRSTATDRPGGALIAAAFLREFVAEGVPWAHLDIAGPAYTDAAPSGYLSNGGTGFGVRTLVSLARSLSG